MARAHGIDFFSRRICLDCPEVIRSFYVGNAVIRAAEDRYLRSLVANQVSIAINGFCGHCITRARFQRPRSVCFPVDNDRGITEGSRHIHFVRRPIYGDRIRKIADGHGRDDFISISIHDTDGSTSRIRHINSIRVGIDGDRFRFVSDLYAPQQVPNSIEHSDNALHGIHGIKFLRLRIEGDSVRADPDPASLKPHFLRCARPQPIHSVVDQLVLYRTCEDLVAMPHVHVEHFV